MRRYAWPITKELRAAIDIQDKANRIAKVKPRKPSWMQRQEQRAIKAELQHDAGMTKQQRARVERHRQEALKASRERIATQKRIGEILSGGAKEQQITETGIVVPSSVEIGKVLSRVRE